MKMDNFTQNIKTHKQQGISTIAMIMVLLFLGILLLNGLNKLTLSWQKSALYEKQYYQNSNQAISALNWAISQTWNKPTSDWQCQTEYTTNLLACIKLSQLPTDNYTLVRGSYRGYDVYYLATYKAASLIIQKGHWLDYCPEKRQLDCG